MEIGLADRLSHLYKLIGRSTNTGNPAWRVSQEPTGPGVERDEVHAKALEVAETLAQGAQSAIRWTKHTLNHWYRQMAPVFDASLAYEMYGFGGPDAREGLAALREKRDPIFHGPTSE